VEGGGARGLVGFEWVRSGGKGERERSHGGAAPWSSEVEDKRVRAVMTVRSMFHPLMGLVESMLG
jgi:hypothetical protein